MRCNTGDYHFKVLYSDSAGPKTFIKYYSFNLNFAAVNASGNNIE
jgi:hypothetical protein